ncbi:MAG: hypothetical protein QM811_23730 [Pirellulales bacterium]
MRGPTLFLRLLAVMGLSCFATGGKLAADDAPPKPAAVKGETSNGETAKPTVSFYKDVRPIFQEHCQGCHQPAKRGGEYLMTEFAALIKGGESAKPAVVAGKPQASYLLEMVTPDKAGKAEMPQDKKPLAAAQIKTITNWIAAGALDDTPAGAKQRFDADHPPIYRQPPLITALDVSPDGAVDRRQRVSRDAAASHGRPRQDGRLEFGRAG